MRTRLAPGLVGNVTDREADLRPGSRQKVRIYHPSSAQPNNLNVSTDLVEHAAISIMGIPSCRVKSWHPFRGTVKEGGGCAHPRRLRSNFKHTWIAAAAPDATWSSERCGAEAAPKVDLTDTEVVEGKRLSIKAKECSVNGDQHQAFPIPFLPILKAPLYAPSVSLL